MKRESNDVLIVNIHKGKKVVATIFEDFSEKNFNDYEQHWKPELQKANVNAREFKKQGKAFAFAEDEMWNWQSKYKDAQAASMSYAHFALECENMTEGLIQLNLTEHRSRANTRHEIVYVEYVSTAPWNRIMITKTPKYKGVGVVLIGQAIGTSIDAGFKGRLCLHSLPGAQTFYQGLGFKDYGPDKNAKGLHYFEIDSDAATAVLKKIAEI